MEINRLVRSAKQGDQDALVRLIMNQKQEFYRLAYVYVKNQQDALDVMEDMIVILYENIHRLKKEESFYSWSKTILVNCCKRHLRSSQKVIPLDSLYEEIHEDEFRQKEEQILLENHLSRLHQKHQEAIRLRYFLDMDYQAISDLMKIPIGTVKSRISIGLKKLKESLGGEF
ncbi:MAG: sigma-70 family RNA polymerase sigma factor [Clostridia bacterium]|nr:sigma-70 family RNA polymerase sigma factor [Clostridia bacterium]